MGSMDGETGQLLVDVAKHSWGDTPVLAVCHFIHPSITCSTQHTYRSCGDTSVLAVCHYIHPSITCSTQHTYRSCGDTTVLAVCRSIHPSITCSHNTPTDHVVIPQYWQYVTLFIHSSLVPHNTPTDHEVIPQYWQYVTLFIHLSLAPHNTPTDHGTLHIGSWYLPCIYYMGILFLGPINHDFDVTVAT